MRAALRLAPLVFVRPGELRKAEWAEIGLGAAEWRIPAEKMKMREVHIVSLSRQALTLLCEPHPLTGVGRYVFPGVRTPARPMSENTVNAALRRLGYGKDEMTGHGSGRWRQRFRTNKAGTVTPSSASLRTGSVTRCVRPTTTRSTCPSGGG